MKKIVFFLLATSFIISCKKDDGGNGGGTTNTSNSPVITSASVAANFSAGKVLSGYITDSNAVAVPTADTGAVYNYASIAMPTPWKDTLQTPNNPANYSSATYMSGLNQQAVGISLVFNQFYQVSSSSWLNLGSYTNGLTATIPNPLDTTKTIVLTVPAQAAKKIASQVLVNFPISYNDSITQTSSDTVKAQAAATYMGFPVNGNIFTTQTTTVKSKNIAWGTLKLNGYADSMKVVVQKYTESIKTDITTDNAAISAFLNPILTQMQITNGQTVTLTSYRFWAVGKGLVMTLNANGKATVTIGL